MNVYFDTNIKNSRELRKYFVCKLGLVVKK